MTKKWPRVSVEDSSHTTWEIGPHLCERGLDCPGPRLVARLKAAEKMAGALRRLMGREGAPETLLIEALSAYESASEPVKEK